MALDAQWRVGAKVVALRLLGDQRSLGRGCAWAEGDYDGGVGRQRLIRHECQPASFLGAVGYAASRFVGLYLGIGRQPDLNGLAVGGYLDGTQHRLWVDSLVKGDHKQGIQGLRSGRGVISRHLGRRGAKGPADCLSQHAARGRLGSGGHCDHIFGRHRQAVNRRRVVFKAQCLGAKPLPCAGQRRLQMHRHLFSRQCVEGSQGHHGLVKCDVYKRR